MRMRSARDIYGDKIRAATDDLFPPGFVWRAGEVKNVSLRKMKKALRLFPELCFSAEDDESFEIEGSGEMDTGEDDE